MGENSVKYYAVTVKCGHVGRKFYTLKTFAIKAESGKEAARISRFLPRVKHHHKDAVREVREIDVDRFLEIIMSNKRDPYFRCQCVQDQRRYVEQFIYPEDHDVSEKEIIGDDKTVYIGKTRLKKPKKYITNYYQEGWAC